MGFNLSFNHNIQVFVPARGGDFRVSPQNIRSSVALAYDAVLLDQQSGLVDAKTPELMNLPMLPEEAWHHYEAALSGAVDSARFLITFSLVPSIQAGGSEIHRAASLGSVQRVRAAISAGEDVNSRNRAGQQKYVSGVIIFFSCRQDIFYRNLSHNLSF